MLLMQSTDKDFKGMAASVVEDHLMNGKSLEECIVEKAKQRNLNPQEIKRLAEKANTQVALEHLRGENKKDDFELAKYDNVLRKTHPVDENYEAEEEDTDFPDDEGKLDDAEDEAMEKETEKTEGRHMKTASLLPHTRFRATAEAFPEAPIEKVAEKRVTSKEYFSLRKQLDAKKLEKTAAELSMMSSVDTLVTALRKRPSSYFEKLAEDAVAVYGDGIRQFLVKTAEALHFEPYMTKTAEQYIDDSDPLLAEIGKVKDFADSVLIKEAEIAELESATRECFKEAAKGC